MTSDDDRTESQTVAKTLWSETVLEMLFVALQKNTTDARLRELLGELQQKNFKASYVIEKVRAKVGEQAARRVQALIRNR